MLDLKVASHFQEIFPNIEENYLLKYALINDGKFIISLYRMSNASG